MSIRTVDWGVPRSPLPSPGTPEGLRERKKRQTRQLLTDTATTMFLEHGFEAVSVSAIAAAANVSQKTVFNYFPTKESLVLDRLEGTVSALTAALADASLDPVDAALGVLADELSAVLTWLDAQPDRTVATSRFRRFGALVRSSPALRAHQRDAVDELVDVVASALAVRTGLAPGDPEPRIGAVALVGLWPLQLRSLGRHLSDGGTARVAAAVTAEVERGAAVIRAGLAGVLHG